MAEVVDLREHRDLHRAIIAKIRDGKSLSVIERGYVMQWLEELWLPKHEVSKRRRRQHWEGVEMLVRTGMHFSPEPRKPLRESAVTRIAEALGMTLEAVQQRLKDHKTARKSHPVLAEVVRASSKPAEPTKRKRR
jgi:hypothetical protein